MIKDFWKFDLKLFVFIDSWWALLVDVCKVLPSDARIEFPGGNFNRQVTGGCHFDVWSHALKFMNFPKNPTPKFIYHTKCIP